MVLASSAGAAVGEGAGMTTAAGKVKGIGSKMLDRLRSQIRL